MKLYIDTNTYLSFVSPTSEIKSLEKLKKLIEKGDVELVLPSQAKSEFLRHFKERVSETKEKLRKLNTKYSIPNELKDRKKEILNDKEKDIIQRIDSLNSDLTKYRAEKIAGLKKHVEIVEKLLKDIFALATFLEYNDEIVLRAVIRYAKDFPPKKNDHKFGDAIIWETLKENIRREDLVIVSTDPDFRGNDKKKIKPNKMLVSEWKKHTRGKLSVYIAVGQFVNTLDKEDKISLDTIKKETLQAGLYTDQSPFLNSINTQNGFLRVNSVTQNPYFSTQNLINLNQPQGSVFPIYDQSTNLINHGYNTTTSALFSTGNPINTSIPSIKICIKCGRMYTQDPTQINLNNWCNECSDGGDFSIYNF